VQEKPEKVRQFLKSEGLTYPVAIDPDMSVAGQFGIRGVPTIILVDRHGKVRYEGYQLPERSEIERAL
jgi:peroxiredoxin